MFSNVPYSEASTKRKSFSGMHQLSSISLLLESYVTLFRAVLTIGILAAICGCQDNQPKVEIQVGNVPDMPVADIERLRPTIVKFCGDCHAMPAPDTFPKEAWHAEVRQGYGFYLASGRSDLEVPTIRDTVSYFRTLAPERLEVEIKPETSEIGSLKLSRSVIRIPDGYGVSAISHLNWVKDEEALLFSDMAGGDITEVRFKGRKTSVRNVGKFAHPGHVEWLREDERLLVSELGTFNPADHEKGRVSWVPALETEAVEPNVLQAGLGRVADSRAYDFDGDNDLDIVVAEFGWRTSGRILYLENTSVSGGSPTYEMTMLDERHGTIHVPLADLNNDGNMDFVALVSQEYELILAFINQGDGTFQKEKLFDAGDPSYGSSGIQLVDMDKDGDLDVLYTNGDTLDSHYLKPYHGVHWLENEGKFPFKHHVLTNLPGAMRAVAGDLDNDGDLDIAAVAYIPPSLLGEDSNGSFDSLIWLEQLDDQKFERHRLERSSRGFMALELGDFDGNSKLDIALGHFSKGTKSEKEWISIWWLD